MSQYPQQYPEYYPAQYQTLFWQEAFGALVGVAILVAVAAWAFSLVKKAFKGEEVKFPL